MKSHWRKRLVPMAATFSISLLLVTACSGGDSTSGSGSGASSAPAADVAAAQAAVDEGMKTEGLDFGLPTEKIDPGVKRVAIISAGQQTPAAAVISAAQVAAAQAMGWETSPILDASLSTDKAAGFMRQAIAEGYDAIAWGALDPLALKGPIDEAVSKGIALACSSCAAPSYEDKVHIQSPDWASQGTLMANSLIASHDGNAKIVGMQDDSFPQVKIRMDQLAETLASSCSGCEYTKINFSSSDLANPGPPSWTAVLAQYPKGQIDAAISPYDAAAVPFYKTAQQQGRTEIQMNSADMASEFANLMTEQNTGIGSDVAGPLTIMGWAGIDQLARQLAGAPTWDATEFPVALVTYENVDKMKDGDLIPTDFDYQGAFKTLWGKQ